MLWRGTSAVLIDIAAKARTWACTHGMRLRVVGMAMSEGHLATYLVDNDVGVHVHTEAAEVDLVGL